LGGRPVRLTALVGEDKTGQVVRGRLAADSRHMDIRIIDTATGLQVLVLYQDGGDRMMIYDVGSAATGQFPEHLVDDVQDCSYAVLPNIDPNRPVLAAALAAGVPVITDVQALTELDDGHNAGFLTAATVLFCSDADLPCQPEQWLRALGDRFGTPLIVMGRADRGAMLTTDQGHTITEVPTILTRPVRCTVGAGDALLAAVLDGLLRDYQPAGALRRATVFASHAIGEPGGATGQPTAAELAALMATAYQDDTPSSHTRSGG
jgi:sugar/nucleoside kinase (ribokinase family)